MAKRVFEIAKELGVKSKAILDKCSAEGIPMNNHMSSVSVGLEATIREWFGGSDQHTAVETSEKVDIDKVRRAKPAKKKAVAKPADEGDEDGGVATLTEPAKAPAPKVTAPPAPPAARTVSAPGLTETEVPSAKQPATERPAAAASAPDDDQGPAPATKAPRQPKPKPAPAPTMNVPKRPKVISPAGEQLKKQTPAKLSGPKVVRIEAPDRIEAPRGPRQGGGGGGIDGPSIPMSRGPQGGGGVRRTGGGAGADQGRDGRNSRRSDSGGGRRRGGGRDWSQQDLADREARLSRSGGFLRTRRRALKNKSDGGGAKAQSAAETGGVVKISEPFTIKDLSAATGVKASEIIKLLFMEGVMATVNSGIDTEKAQEIMMNWEIELQVDEAKTAETQVAEKFGERTMLDERPRSPIVAILGHVDHGKTSLLDRIRHANVASGEAGGITQATSAFRVPVHVGDDDKQIVFLDTPGHEAFTAMRARGASVTDIVVLVVAADDGVMPQTVESINHAKAAGTPIIVALNKIDVPQATDSNIQRILGQLAEHELNPTEWGGDTEVVRVSAVTGEGIDNLLVTLDLQAQLMELTGDFKGPARGSVVESAMVEGRGATANLLVQDGELKIGDFIVAGRAFGRVRDITDDRGNKLKHVLPVAPVQISGLSDLPDAGDKFYIVDSLKKAQNAAEERIAREREVELATPKVTLDNLFSTMADAEVKELLVVVKADVQGSVEVLKKSIEDVHTDEVRTRVLHAVVGGITESDVLLAHASGAIIIGFNVIASSKARQLADAKGVEIRLYQVIYDIVDDIKLAVEGMLTPELRQQVLGHAEVRAVFKITKVGAVAGCYVTDGTIERNAFIRVTRDDIVIENDRTLDQLKRFKDDAKEVRSGQECGMKIAGYDDIKEGDILECYKQVEVRRKI
ncbi:MAG: translation initiation factor IF-2 [Phycisphaeraceae bacterium]|nr:translation initiation factor IF-2 [Phycisphaeraceae bacterium]